MTEHTPNPRTGKRSFPGSFSAWLLTLAGLSASWGLAFGAVGCSSEGDDGAKTSGGTSTVGGGAAGTNPAGGNPAIAGSATFGGSPPLGGSAPVAGSAPSAGKGGSAGSMSPAGSGGSAGTPASSGGTGGGSAGTNAGGAGGSSGSPSGSGGGGAGASSGGAAGTAGASGGGTGGTGGTGTVTGKFSDDFEGAALNSKWVPRINGQGTFALDTSQKHGGMKSLHVTPKSGYSTLLAFEDASIFPAPNNTFYGRVWFRVPALPGNAHVIWLEAGDTTNDTHEVRIGMNLGYLQTNLWLNGEVDLRDPAAMITANTWHCLEFKMGPDDLVVWFNGTESTAISTKNWASVGNGANGGGQPRTNWSPTYKAFRLGWELNAGSDIWYDDVALGHSRIGCD